MIGFISNKVAVDEIDRALRKTDKRYKFLIESVRDGLQSQRALAKNHAARVDTNNCVHISSNIKLCKGLNARSRSILDILLGFFEFFSQLDAGVCEDDSLEIYKLAFFEADIDDWASVANDDDLGVLVSLFNGESFLGYLLVASVDALSKSDDTIFFGDLQGSLQGRDRTTILIDFVDV